MDTIITPKTTQDRKMGCLPMFGLLLLTVIITVVVTLWAANNYLFAKRFDPVTLDAQEESTLQQKLARIGLSGLSPEQRQQAEALKPEAYTEVGANREIALSEKELNALLAKNTDMAQKLAIALTDNLASAKLLVPLDPEFPIFGGKTLKVTAGLELAYSNSRPVVVLKGVSVWGVPIPNAWLGNLKNVDLVQEFGAQDGFWKAFADGVDNIRVQQGSLLVKLRE